MSYQGYIVTVPFGQGGLDMSQNRTNIIPTKLIDATNIEMVDDMAGKEGGSTKFNSAAISGGAVISSGIDYFPTSAIQRTVISTSDGKLMKDDGTAAFATTLKSGLGTDKVTVFVEGGSEATGNNKKLFAFNGFDPVQVLSADGAATANLATPPADWTGNAQPVAGALHNFRLWAIKDHFLYGSQTGSHEVFTAGNSQLFAVWPGEGIRLNGILPFFGRLFLFKEPYGVYYYDDSDSGFSRLAKITSAIGLAGPKALAYGRNEAFFLSNEGGLHFLSGVSGFGDVRDTDIMTLLNIEKLVRDDINQNRLDRAQVIYYEQKKLVLVAYTSKTGTRNDRVLKIDIAQPNNLKASISTKDSVESVWMRRDPTLKSIKPYYGGSDGFVRKADQENRNVDSVAYSARMQTPHLTFEHVESGLKGKNKLFDFLELEAKPVGNYSVNCDIYIDGDYSETIAFNMGSSGAALDSFVLDTDRVDGLGITTRKQYISGHGRAISCALYNSGINEDFQLASLTFGFRVGDEDLRT